MSIDAQVERAILRVAVAVMQRWLLVVNAGLVVFVTLPFLAPLLMERGYIEPARLIYTAYRMTCHQEPGRSYFLAGPRLTYTTAEVEALTEVRPTSDYLGSPQTGYKMAYCERDTATYLAILLGGFLFGVLGRRVPRLPLRVYLLFIAPLAIDGLTQLTGLRESTWLLRTISGGLFGVGTAWLLYPALDDTLRKTVGEFAARLRQA